ncbi:hypothetical protein B0J13DRAFT_639301 [Dactylonectria estremocensis]|uniref:MACPF-like domain-containing protein n=1 Tax=Dactylonectria estremocensis TaxID=1079267 RepID=A0A9P9EM70_9HYPO|nr:hypothetical protein B0J13DRAFT_639301 [Dactylonectria estremocensis]
MATSTWSEFHIAILSNDSTLFPSFPSKQLSGGDADKILLADIRKYAAASQKLRFTADGKTILNDDTSLSYYMSLRGDKSDGLNKEQDKERASGDTGAKPAAPKDGEKKSDASNIDAQQKPAIKTVQVDLILNSASGSGGDGKTSNAPVDLAKIQGGIDKMIENLKSDGAVKLGDLTKLSGSLGALKIDSMNFAAAAGTVTYPEPLDLTELQWDAVFRNNRALHGWFYKDNMLVKARKKAFQLKPSSDAELSRPQPSAETKTESLQEKTNSGDGAKDTSTQKTSGKEGTPTTRIGPVLPVPPFYVWDDASVEVTEMTSALEKTMADQGFSSTAVKAAGGGGAMGAQASASLAIETEHSTADKKLKAEEVKSIHVAYKFPRAAVEVDAYCLQLTEECKRQALACRNRADVDRWQREYGSVFATQFTLGGELTSSRLFRSTDEAELLAVKDSLKIAAGLSISTPYVSAGASYGSSNSNEKTEGEKKAQQSMRLAWQARGGDTLLCSNPPLWTNTVRDYRLWRITNQEGMVKMIDLVKSIHLKAGNFLENPETASKKASTTDSVWGLLSTALKDPQKYPVADKIKEFYESNGFSLDEFNASLDQDGEDLRLNEKVSWPKLDGEQKVYVGLLCYNKKLILQD